MFTVERYKVMPTILVDQNDYNIITIVFDIGSVASLIRESVIPTHWLAREQPIRLFVIAVG